VNAKVADPPSSLEGRRSPQLRIALAGMLAALVVQFWLGMWVNLFVDVPKSHPGANPPEYFSGVARSVTWALTLGASPWLTLHAALGLVLVLASFGLLARAIAIRSRGLIVAFSLGVIGVLGAGFNGGSFLNYHEDFSSMLMATGFAVAIISYAVSLALAA